MAVDQATDDNTTTTSSNDEQAEVVTTDDAENETQAEEGGEQPGEQEAGNEQEDSDGKDDSDKGDNKAPESYELKVPEGFEFAEGELEALTEKAKALDLSNEQAQALVEMKAEWSAQAQDEAQANLGKLAESWAEEIKADKEVGGERFNESMQDVKRAMDSFATDELKTALDETGFGNHPQLFRFVARVGKALREDENISGDRGNSSPRTPANVLYPTKEDS